MKMLSYVIIILLVAGGAYAETDFKVLLGECEWQNENPYTGLMDAKKVKIKNKEYVFSIWTHGAHGETLRIFDPSQKASCLLFEKTSGWDIQYEIKEDHVEVTYSRETSIDDPTPISKKTIFRP